MSSSSPIPIVIPHLDPMAEIVHLRAMVEELQKTVADLRRTIEAKDAHIHRLVKMAFGSRSERIEGPTLFDGLVPPEPIVAVVEPIQTSESPTIPTANRAAPVRFGRRSIERVGIRQTTPLPGDLCARSATARASSVEGILQTSRSVPAGLFI